MGVSMFNTTFLAILEYSKLRNVHRDIWFVVETAFVANQSPLWPNFKVVAKKS